MLTKRFIEKLIERASIARAVSIWWADRKAAAWRRRNPGKPFSDYYADHVRKHLDAGKPHPTLGSQASPTRSEARSNGTAPTSPSAAAMHGASIAAPGSIR